MYIVSNAPQPSSSDVTMNYGTPHNIHEYAGNISTSFESSSASISEVNPVGNQADTLAGNGSPAPAVDTAGNQPDTLAGNGSLIGNGSP